MDTITLNDGTVFVGSVLENGDGRVIFVYLDGLRMQDGFSHFINPEKTKKIIAMSSGVEHIYLGYTNLTAINSEYGNCNITMQKG